MEVRQEPGWCRAATAISTGRQRARSLAHSPLQLQQQFFQSRSVRPPSSPRCDDAPRDSGGAAGSGAATRRWASAVWSAMRAVLNTYNEPLSSRCTGRRPGQLRSHPDLAPGRSAARRGGASRARRRGLGRPNGCRTSNQRPRVPTNPPLTARPTLPPLPSQAVYGITHAGGELHQQRVTRVS